MKRQLIECQRNTAKHSINYKTKPSEKPVNTDKNISDFEIQSKKQEKKSDKLPKRRNELWAEYLETIPWNYFATFTTPYEMSLKSARRIMERYHNKMNIEGRDDWMFWVAEKFKLKDGYHLHALIKTEFPWCKENLWLLWQDVSVFNGQKTNKNGNVINRADIRDRDFNKSAGSYLCKYLTKSVSDFDILT